MTLNEARGKSATTIEELLKYCNNVIEGKEIACIKHKWACMRFLNDIENQGKKDFPYIFSEERANKFLMFMPFFRHTKGPLTKERKIPELIEKFIFGNVYGWIHKNTSIRRFRKFYYQVGRKNAKSQDLAIVSIYEMAAFGEPYSEVYIGATKKDQTRYVWGEARSIITECPELKGKIIIKFHDDLSQKVIMHPKTNSFFARLSKEDKKKGDGGNPQFFAIDEYHAQPTDEYYNIGTSGMKTRKQPLLGIITTAGFELNHPCYRDEYQYISSILNPDIEINNDRYFAMVCELDMDEEGNLVDDIKDEKSWLKSNPIIGKTDIGKEAIRDELMVAQDKPEKMRDFLTKTMDVWVNQRACGYMNMAKWKACGASKENPWPDINGLEVTCGYDLSVIIDLTSIGFEIPLPDERIAVMSHSFLPEGSLFAKMKTDKVPYDRWIKEGWITKTEGNTVDYRIMFKWCMEFIKKHGLIEKDHCFDRYLANRLLPELSEEGHNIIEIPQGIPTLGEPTKDFRAKVYDKKMIHNNNPVLSWAMGNAVTTGGAKVGITERGDKNENFMLDKSQSSFRIDPAASMMNAHVRIWLNEKSKSSVYNHRGVIFL